MLLDPVEIAIQFDTARSEIESSEVLEHCFEMAALFLRKIDGDESLQEAYLPELVDLLAMCLDKRNGVGNPALLSELHTHLSGARQSGKLLPSRSSEIHAVVTKRLILRWASLGEWERCAFLMEISSDESPAGYFDNTFETPREQLRNWLAIPETSRLDSRRKWDELYRDWAEEVSVKREEVWLPVSCSRRDDKDSLQGDLLRQRIFIRLLENAETDEWSLDTLSQIGNRCEYGESVRKITELHYPELTGRNFRAEFRTDSSNAVTGESGGLAAGLTFHNALGDQAGSRTSWKISRPLAFTGKLDRDGNLMAVDPDGLRQKVRLVFFSCLDGLVLPESQLELARQILSECQESCPRRNLYLRGHPTFSDVFTDRMAVDVTRQSLLAYTKRQLWRHRVSVAGWVIAATCALALLWFLLPPLDKNVVGFRTAGEEIVLLNRHDQEIERVWSGPGPVLEIEGLQRVSAPIGQRGPQLGHIDSDGILDVCWFADRNRSKQFGIRCKISGEDANLFEYEFSDLVRYPNRPEFIGRSFFPEAMMLTEVDDSGVSKLFVLYAHDPSFPSVVVRLDPRTGFQEAVYIHHGRITGFDVISRSNGVKDLFLAGVNYEYRQGFVAILDPLFEDAQGVSGNLFRLPGYQMGIERAYVRFPKSRVGEALSEVVAYGRVSPNRGLIVRYNSEQGRYDDELKVYLYEVLPSANPMLEQYFYGKEATSSEEKFDASKAAYLVVSIDRDLQILGVNPSDMYTETLKWLLETGRIEGTATFNDDYVQFRLAEILNRFKSDAKYWRHDGWQDVMGMVTAESAPLR